MLAPTPASPEAAGVRETDPHFLVGIHRCEGREVHAGKPHVGSNTDRRDGYVAHARVLHLTRDELREHTLDLGFYAALSLRFRTH